MEGLQFFDCNVQVGRMGYKHPLQMWRTEDILAEMERTGIAGALVYHGLSKTHAPMYGNRLLEQELAKSPRLFGCWAVLPEHVGDFMSPDELISEMQLHHIKAAKIFQGSHAFNLDSWTTERLCSALSQAQIPLIMDAQEANYMMNEYEWERVAGLLQRHPDLRVILHNLAWGQERRLFPILDRFANLYVEMSTLQANEFIEYTYQRFGADQLLFGSGMPFKSPGAGRAFIDYARIPDEAKMKIAGGNLSALLGVKPPAAAMPEQDEITARASRGLPILVPVLDSHTHIIEDHAGTGSGWPMIGGDIDPMVELYRSIGISKMSVAPWVGVNGGDTAAGNQIAELARDRYPDEVEAYVRIDPNYGEDVETEARKWHLQKRFKGMKPYYFNERIPYTAKLYEPWWKLGNSLRLYALVDPGQQSDEDYMDQIDTLASLYPEISIFMDHGGRSFDIAVKYAEVAKRHPHVSIQLTYTSVTLGVIEYLTAEVGAEKVLFGTDSSMRDPRPQVGWLAYANLPLEDKKLIFGGNFQKILSRSGL
ncbi:amidohydrolase family protein [Paenibacillus eucommiae]|uniref:TIM-barrel fold metal-dependent hydrolase n=1 Tax=Paenibacillus eucommiae TaxID=1355755 RepID=A0ABS4IWJ8_9BACL|nr:amidohydrolase family protein [Paenibacillus eucommiae]MBP1991968.1 putative TIM-barrel fold metal-dependent hydrolase [Paenibacillus eucommiae]